MTDESELLQKYDTSSFEDRLAKFSVRLEKRQICQFLIYYELLTEWNKVMNLTTVTDYAEVVQKHFIDSLSIVTCVDFAKVHTLIDVGTGAGFPGIPLKIVFPDMEVTLLDSLRKRVSFLEEVIGRLGLTGIEAVHGRAEDFARPGKLRDAYDLCVSRAVANLTTLSEYCIPFVKKDGMFVSYKSGKISDELRDAERAIELLGGVVKKRIDFVLPDSAIDRTIILVQKKKETPKRFPRKAGFPLKEPLH